MKFYYNKFTNFEDYIVVQYKFFFLKQNKRGGFKNFEGPLCTYDFRSFCPNFYSFYGRIKSWEKWERKRKK